MTEMTTYLSGTVLDENTHCCLAELCSLCGITAEMAQEMINEGLIAPQGISARQWHFTYVEVRRVQTALRLQRDLRINLPGCALILELLEELEELRQIQR